MREKCFFTMADFTVDVSKLPDDVRDKLAELDLELSEGKFCCTYYVSKYYALNQSIIS